MQPKPFVVFPDYDQGLSASVRIRLAYCGRGTLTTRRELRIERRRMQKLLVRSSLNHTTFVHNKNLVTADDSRASMRHDKGGASDHQPPQGLLESIFESDIQGGGGFIKNQNAGISDESPSESEALLLTTAQANAVFSQHGLQAARQS